MRLCGSGWKSIRRVEEPSESVRQFVVVDPGDFTGVAPGNDSKEMLHQLEFRFLS